MHPQYVSEHYETMRYHYTTHHYLNLHQYEHELDFGNTGCQDGK